MGLRGKRTTILFATTALILHMNGAARAVNTLESETVKTLPPTGDVLNIAHRGASAYAPEHTLAAYQMAVNQGADYLEIDIQMTKDGRLIAMHDETVNRTTNGNGAVKHLTLEQIKQLDAGSWFNKKYPQYAKDAYLGAPVLTLDEIFQTFGSRVGYYIETKTPELYPGMEEKLVQIMKKYHLIGRNGQQQPVIIESFSPESLLKIHKLEPSIPLVQLLWFIGPSPIQEIELLAIKGYADGVAPNYNHLTQTYVKKAHAYGLSVHPYTVNETADMKKLIGWGVDGLITNFPDTLQEVKKDQPDDITPFSAGKRQGINRH